jgi:PPP family 3-phenylpropionic acid transporter
MTGTGSTRLLYLLMLFTTAAWAPRAIFFPVYLSKDCGIALELVGVLIAVPIIVSVVAGSAWSSFSDTIGRKKPFLALSAFVMTLTTFAITLFSSFGPLLLLGVLGAFLTPHAEGLMAASVFGFSGPQTRGTAYSRFAIWGSIGWTAATVLGGVMGSIFGVKAVLYFSSLLFFFAMIVSFLVPEPRTGKIARPGRNYLAPVVGLLKKREIAIFLLVLFPLFMAINMGINFLPVYMDSSGAPPILISMTFAAPAVIEVPLFLYFGKFSDRIGRRKPLLILSALTFSLRFLLFALTSNPYLLFSINLTLALTWPSLDVASSAFISDTLQPEKWVTGQTVYRIMLWGIAATIGPFVGGLISGAWGLPMMFAFASTLAVVSAVFSGRITEK